MVCDFVRFYSYGSAPALVLILSYDQEAAVCGGLPPPLFLPSPPITFRGLTLVFFTLLPQGKLPSDIMCSLVWFFNIVNRIIISIPTLVWPRRARKVQTMSRDGHTKTD